MANFNFNKIILGGRLTADPELRQTQTGIPVASFSIAVSRRVRSQQDQQGAEQQPQADFFNCTAWRQQAEFISRFFRKGSSICVIGTLQNRSWTDQQGVKRFATDIVVDEASFVDSKSDNPMGDTPGYQPAPPMQQYAPEPNYASNRNNNVGDEVAKFEDLQSDDDLPF
jgi:single stranded DNA-binding protein (ssb)